VSIPGRLLHVRSQRSTAPRVPRQTAEVVPSKGTFCLWLMGNSLAMKRVGLLEDIKDRLMVSRHNHLICAASWEWWSRWWDCWIKGSRYAWRQRWNHLVNQ
jgi:hypothetical protein